MSQEILYHCCHLEQPAAPLPPSYPSSFADYSPLSSLYFCEECDAIRCDQCVAVEVASYFCPNCLFDVPGANVRADKNR
jgi:dynactin-4